MENKEEKGFVDEIDKTLENKDIETGEEELETMGLSYPEIVTLNSGFTVTPYMPHEAVNAVIETLKGIHDYADREYALDCMLLELNCEPKGNYDYDLLMANGVFTDIRGVLEEYVDLIYDSLEHDESLNSIVKDFLTSAEGLMTSVEGKIPNKESTEQLFQTLTEKVKTGELEEVLKQHGKNNTESRTA